MNATFKKNPEIDFFIGFMGGTVVPTKQDKFKPLTGYQIFFDEKDETRDLSGEFELYIKKKRKGAHKEFEDNFKKQIRENLTEEHPYPKEVKLEVIVSVSMDQKRLNDADIDNLIKSVLDCFSGLVYEDDSQIVSVYGVKDVNPLVPINALMVGIRKLSNKNESWFNDVKLAYFEYEQ